MRIWLRQWIYLRLQHFPAVSCYICVSSCFILQFKPSKAKGDCLLTQVWVGGLSTCESVCSGLDAPFFHMNTLLEDTTQPIGPPWWRQGSSCVCVCSSVNLCVLFVVCVWLLVFIRLHVYACLTEDNEQSSMCNRCSSQLELICCYQRAQHSLQHQLRWNPIDLRRKASARLQYVGKRRWTLGLFNCCVGVADGSACPILGRNKANIVIAATQTCLPIYLLSFSGGEEKGWRGVKLGWQWQIKLVTFFLSFSFFFFFLLFCGKAAPSDLKLMLRTCFPLSRREYQGNVYFNLSLFITPSSLSLSFFLPSSFPFYPLTSLWFIIYVAMWPRSIDSASW